MNSSKAKALITMIAVINVILLLKRFIINVSQKIMIILTKGEGFNS
jgi:hypothetical protein